MKELLEKSIFLALIVISLWSCSSGISVVYDNDKTADWENYRSFRVQHPDIAELQKMQVKWIDKMSVIETGLIGGMMERGYVQSTEADLIITYFIEVADKQKAYSSSVYMGGGGYYTPFRYGVSTTNVDIVNYKEGTLYVDVVDAKTNQQIWHGAGTKTLAESGITSKQDAAINKAIQSIFYRFKHKSPDYVKP